MKKPKIDLTDEWTQSISVNNGEDSLYPYEVAEAYEEMIDVLIETRDLINQKYFIREGDSMVLAKIEEVLLKAGCTE